MICCIRKDGGELKGEERERQRNVKKNTRQHNMSTDTVDKFATQTLHIQSAAWFGVGSWIQEVFI